MTYYFLRQDYYFFEVAYDFGLNFPYPPFFYQFQDYTTAIPWLIFFCRQHSAKHHSTKESELLPYQWLFEDGFIHLRNNNQLVLGISHDSTEVRIYRLILGSLVNMGKQMSFRSFIHASTLFDVLRLLYYYYLAY